MANLAIKGHATRGREVIELLEMLGGKNGYKLSGTNEECVYYEKNGRINNTAPVVFNNYKLFALEQFLEKFPYKVGDKVQHRWATSCGSIYVIEQLKWEDNQVKYIICDLYWKNCKCTVTSKDLQPYKEETMGTITIDDFKANTKEWLIDKLESMSKDNALQAICNIYDELHKPKYPKTYEECLKILGYNIAHTIPMNHGHNGLLMMKLQRLLICRDAYWKIAGEQMGLGEPWKLDYKNPDIDLYVIINIYNRVEKAKYGYGFQHCLFAFPTEEMRDAFKENFDKDLEFCKELL